MFNCDRFELQEPQIHSRSEDGLKPERLLGNIEFEKVDFIYETRPEKKVTIYPITVATEFSLMPVFHVKKYIVNMTCRMQPKIVSM